MRLAIAFALGVITATPIAGAVALGARTEASREMTTRHDSLDAEYRVACARGVEAGVAWMRLAESKAAGLTDGRVWVTTLTEEGP